MGVPRFELPSWDGIQIMVAQLARKPLMEDVAVGTELIIGPEAQKPLRLEIPLFVSDMSFGALSEERRPRWPWEQSWLELGFAPAKEVCFRTSKRRTAATFTNWLPPKFGFEESLLTRVQAFHFKCGQGAKTGTGGHLPGKKNIGRISEVRGIEAGKPAVSPPTFSDLNTVEDFKRFGDRVREITGGIPIGYKLSAQHIERDIDFAWRAVLTTSSSMGAAAALAQLRCFSAITSPCPPFQRWRARVIISTRPAPLAASL